MTAQILDGNSTLASIKVELKDRVAALRERGVVPGLGTVLVGDDPGSHWYVNAKHKDCAEIGITSLRRDLPATASQAEVEAVIDELNADPACTGFIVRVATSSLYASIRLHSHGGGLCTQRPATIVATTCTSRSSSGAIASGSPSRTTRSA